MTKEIIGYIAAGISFLAYIPYIVEYVGGSTKTNPLTKWMWKYCGLRGDTKPHQASWLIWATLQWVIFSTTTGPAKWIAFGYLIGSSLNTILLFWYGEKKWSWLDISCLLLALASITLLYVVKDEFWALVFAITADGIGAVPTIVGVTKNPKDESRLGWSIFMVGTLVNIFAISKWGFQEAGFTIYLLFVIGYVAINVWRSRK